MLKLLSKLPAILLILAALGLVLCGKRPSEFRLPLRQGDKFLTGLGPPIGRDRIVITFWEKWTRHEAAALQDLVDRFNLSQDRIFVNLVSMSQINQKLLIAIAGGDPPDIAGLWAAQMGPFVANHAIEPLDELRADKTITPDTYKPFIWSICAPEDRLYAASATPSSCALYWNKAIFAQAHITAPPKTMEELDALADRLVVRHGQDIVRLGFLPNEPIWWDPYWGVYWGNHLYDRARDRFELDTPAQRLAYTWYQDYFRRYGPGETDTFKSGFGEFASPQNAFLSGKVAMVVQGPFFCKFIELNQPNMIGNYGVTFVPLPAALGKPPGAITQADLDVWVIPRGKPHRAEALEVLRFLTRQDNMERLCKAHGKPSPLRAVSADFPHGHPNPYIDIFEETMWAPDIQTTPQSPVWEQVRREIDVAVGNLWRDPAHYRVETTLRDLQACADQIVATYQHYAHLRAPERDQHAP